MATAKAERRPTVVLVVDDDDLIRGVVRTTLEDEGVFIIEASDGAEALRLASERGPDLVLLDVMMPGIDGYEVCRALRANPQTSRTPVVMLTAKTSLESQDEGLAAGADAYMTKPFSPLELIETVRRTLADGVQR